MYPCLSQMALDYLSIPGTSPFCSDSITTNVNIIATSVDVERVFSRGRLLISHVRSRLNAQTTRAVLCVGNWSLHGMVKDTDASAVAQMPDIEGDDEFEMEEGYDKILL